MQDDNALTIAEIVHRNHLVELYPKEKTLPAMIEEYVPMDRLHDDFYQSFMEQRTQKIDDTEQPGTENSLPFPFELLRTTLTTLPRIKSATLAVILEPTLLLFCHLQCQ